MQLSAGDYGVLGVFAAMLASAITVLFFRYEKLVKAGGEEREKMAKERESWKTEREGIETDYERKHRELAEEYAKRLREDREASRKNESEARQEFAEMMEKIAAGQTRTSEQLVAMLQKFYDRFVSPTSRR